MLMKGNRWPLCACGAMRGCVGPCGAGHGAMDSSVPLLCLDALRPPQDHQLPVWHLLCGCVGGAAHKTTGQGNEGSRGAQPSAPMWRPTREGTPAGHAGGGQGGT